MLGPDDVALMEALSTMFGQAFNEPETYGGVPPARHTSAACLVAIPSSPSPLCGAATVVGGLAAYQLRKFEQERSEIYIYDLAVAAAYRRQGIATALIEQLKVIAAARGAYVIYVQADLEDSPAIELYTKLGTREDVLHFDIAVG
jgi:aminoglycoside 3-N-acetyltransferase I